MQLNKPVLKTSLLAFLLGFLPPLVIDLLIGFESLFAYPWTFIGIAFHEVGHLLFGFLVSPVLVVVFPLSFLSEPIRYLGGFLFNCIAALLLLAFSLFTWSRIVEGKLPKRFKGMNFSFLLLAYINLYFANFTLVLLSPVVGSGRDLSVASSLLQMPLQELINQMWVVHWITFAAAFAINAFFILRKP